MYINGLWLCLGWKGQWICCVTRGREGGKGGGEEGREGGHNVGEGGREEGGREGMTVIHILMVPQY